MAFLRASDGSLACSSLHELKRTKNRKELLLTHLHAGVDLDMQFASETLNNIFNIWKRPVTIQTSYENKPVHIQFDGKELSVTNT